MLLSTKANQLAGWGEEGRLAQATEKPSLFHGGLARVGEVHSMQLLQRIVNSLSGLGINCLSFVTWLALPRNSPACTGVPTGDAALRGAARTVLFALGHYLHRCHRSGGRSVAELPVGVQAPAIGLTGRSRDGTGVIGVPGAEGRE
jgi:hypothetical protein